MKQTFDRIILSLEIKKINEVVRITQKFPLKAGRTRLIGINASTSDDWAMYRGGSFEKLNINSEELFSSGFDAKLLMCNSWNLI